MEGVDRFPDDIVPLTLLTAQGDIPYATAAAAWAALAKGTARQALIMNSGATAPSWGDSLASLLTTQGDLPYASSANTPARLAKGTAFQQLRMNSGATAPEWAGAVGARANHNTTQSINNATLTAVVYNTEDYDTNAIHDTSSNTSRFTVPTGMGGKWRITIHSAWTANATGIRQQFVRKNGTTYLTGGEGVSAASAQETYLTSSMEVVLAAADYVEQMVQQTSGGALTMISGDTAMSMMFVGA